MGHEDRRREAARNVAKAEAEGRVADSLDARKALVARMEAGELTHEQVLAELRKLKRGAKKQGKVTRAQAAKGY